MTQFIKKQQHYRRREVASGVMATVMLLAMMVLAACSFKSRQLGYGMLLWPVDGFDGFDTPPQQRESGGTQPPTILSKEAAQDGELVAVIAKSNITKTWIVERRGAAADPDRFEVPLWALSGPMKEKDARKAAMHYEPWRGVGAAATTDGLPIRAQAMNSSRRVYRLKIGQRVNVLGQWESEPHDGPMEVPANGGVPLDGVWLDVITGDGSRGWCFSHNLKIVVSG